MIYRIALNNLKNHADAEDILQEVLTELITKCPADKTDEGVKCWLIRVTVNKCNGFRRLVWQTRTEVLENHLTREAPEQEHVMEEIFELPKKQPVSRLSTGQQNQLEVVLALSQGADYILMDEPFAGNDVFNREDFYKALLGLLTETETVLLSTHLIEEVQGFVGRALLLHEGALIGDVDMTVAEERGENLMDVVRRAYGYRPGRVCQALQALEGDGDDA